MRRWIGGPRAGLLPLVSLALAALAFHAIVLNYFAADDFFYLYRSADGPLLPFLLEPHYGHLLFVRNAIFALCYAAFGTRAQWYFVLVLLTHLANVLLLYRVVRRLTGSPGLACAGAALWGVAPAHEGTLGWYSVYGQVLVATMLLLVLDGVARRVRDGATVGWRPAAVWSLLLLVASGSFGLGIGLAVAFPALLACVAGRAGLSGGAWRVVLATPAVVIVVYLLAVAHAARTFLGPSDWRWLAFPHSMLARPGSWPGALALLAHLLGYGVAGLLIGAVDRSFAYPGPAALAAVAAFAGVVGAGVMRAAPPRRREALGLALLALASYGMIALGRAELYERIEISAGATYGRYHYVGMLLLCLLLCLGLGHLASAERLARLPRRALLALLVVVMARAAAGNSRAIDHQVKNREETARTVGAMRAQIDATAPASPVLIRNRPFGPAGLFPLPDGSPYPGWLGTFVIFFPANTVDGRPVFFLSDQDALFAAARPGSRTEALLRREGGS